MQQQDLEKQVDIFLKNITVKAIRENSYWKSANNVIGVLYFLRQLNMLSSSAEQKLCTSVIWLMKAARQDIKLTDMNETLKEIIIK